MSEKTDREQIAEYWSTSISDISPGKISFCGYAIQDLIGKVSFPAMVWLLLRVDLPSKRQAAMLEAAMVSSVDHGPHAPSIAVSKIAISTGLPLNGAMASAINCLDDVHGGLANNVSSCMTRCSVITIPASPWRPPQ